MSGALIAVDWGTTRARAYLIRDGTLVETNESQCGVQSVVPGGFPDVLRQLCGRWLTDDPQIPILLAGMVGSRNGWVEAAYVAAPCGLDDIARQCMALDLDGHKIQLVPGVEYRGTDGFYDVMRGEETLVLGANRDGLYCLPGTHSKWIVVEGSKITNFATFITGELFAAMSSSFIGRLAEQPIQSQPASTLGQGAAGRAGGLARALFQTRARVLSGDMPGAGVQAFLSSLLIHDEISQARQMYGSGSVTLIASEPQASIYAEAIGHEHAWLALNETFLAGAWQLFLTMAAK